MKIKPRLKPETILLMSVREALIIMLGALEDYLQLERSIVPRRKRARDRNGDVSSDDEEIDPIAEELRTCGPH